MKHMANVSGQPPVEIATYQSPPFSMIAAQTLKPSQNLYTELILRTLGEVVPPLLRQFAKLQDSQTVKGPFLLQEAPRKTVG